MILKNAATCNIVIIENDVMLNTFVNHLNVIHVLKGALCYLVNTDFIQITNDIKVAQFKFHVKHK